MIKHLFKRRALDLVILFLILVSMSIYLFHNRNSPATSYTVRDFDITMTEVQEGLLKRGYTIDKIQPIDKGLDKAGYKLENYRVIFYRNKIDSKRIHNSHPEFTTLLPLTLTIVKDKHGTKIISTPYKMLLKNAPADYIKRLVLKWKKDSREIVKEVISQPAV